MVRHLVVKITRSTPLHSNQLLEYRAQQLNVNNFRQLQRSGRGAELPIGKTTKPLLPQKQSEQDMLSQQQQSKRPCGQAEVTSSAKRNRVRGSVGGMRYAQLCTWNGIYGQKEKSGTVCVILRTLPMMAGMGARGVYRTKSKAKQSKSEPHLAQNLAFTEMST